MRFDIDVCCVNRMQNMADNEMTFTNVMHAPSR